MEQEIYSEKIQKIISNVGLLNNGKYAPEPNTGYRFPIRSTKFKDTLWVRIEKNQFVISLSGNKNEDGHKKIYQYIGRDYDRQDTQSKEWQFTESEFNKIEDIITCYAEVEKENMEIEFYPSDQNEFKLECFKSKRVCWVAYKNDDIFYSNIRKVNSKWGDSITVKNQLETQTISGKKVRDTESITKLRAFASDGFLEDKGTDLEKILFADDFYFSKISPLLDSFLNYKIDNKKVDEIVKFINRETFA